MRKIAIIWCALFAMAAHAQQRIMADRAEPARMNGYHVRMAASEATPRKAEGLSDIQRAVGYIVDNNPDSITLKGAFIGTAGTYPVGAEITEEMLEPYVGCKVVGIRVAAALSLGKSNVFLYPVRGGAASEGITKSQRLYEGWNNVFFNGDNSWTIEEGMSILVGFDYIETATMAQEQKGGICTVGESKGNDFLIYNDYGNGLAWYRISNLGALCVQLIMDVSSLPETALQLSYLDTGFRYKRAGEKIELYAITNNVGRRDVNAFTIQCQIDDTEPVNFSYQETIREQGNVHKQPEVALPEDIPLGQHQITVTVLPEQATEPTGNQDSQTSVFYVYDKYLQKQKNYVEQYNSQNEYMASIVNPIFNQVASSNNRMALVNVYDEASPLAIGEAAYLHELYAYTVPAFTINRSYFPGENYIAYDVNYYAEQYAALVPAIIKDLLSQDLQMPAFATVELSPTYNPETRQLDIDVSGELAEGGMDILGTPAVTLLLTENNVPSKQVVADKLTGRTTTQQDYVHHHVLRKFVTSPIGDVVSVNGNRYEAHFSTTIDEAWQAGEMTLVGFLTRAADEVNDGNVMQMDVTNCNSVDLSELSGIKGVASIVKDTATEWLTLDGRQVSSTGLPPGIYVVRQGTVTRKVVVK